MVKKLKKLPKRDKYLISAIVNLLWYCMMNTKNILIMQIMEEEELEKFRNLREQERSENAETDNAGA